MSLTPLRICAACRRADGLPANPCVCPADGGRFADHADAYQCPRGKFPTRGLGDVVSRITKFLGFEECDRCKKSRAALNKLFPKTPSP